MSIYSLFFVNVALKRYDIDSRKAVRVERRKSFFIGGRPNNNPVEEEFPLISSSSSLLSSIDSINGGSSIFTSNRLAVLDVRERVVRNFSARL